MPDTAQSSIREPRSGACLASLIHHILRAEGVQRIVATHAETGALR